MGRDVVCFLQIHLPKHYTFSADATGILKTALPVSFLTQQVQTIYTNIAVAGCGCTVNSAKKYSHQTSAIFSPANSFLLYTILHL